MASKSCTVTLESLLEEIVDVDSVARWPDPAYTCRQASSYDRAKIAPDKPGWFGNNDRNQYIRTEQNAGRTEHVMMDMDGPGCMVRFWIVTNEAKQGKTRIYLDGASEPVIATKTHGMLLNDAFEVDAPWLLVHPGSNIPGQGGNTLYLPIPYKRHCKVTWEDADPARGGDICYHINYRTYSQDTKVETFCHSAMESARTELDRVGKLLLAPPSFPGERTLTLERQLAAGAEAALDLPAGPAAVRQLALRVKAANAVDGEAALRSTVVKMTFDGEETVWCPASDFFGSGFGLNELRSWYRTVDKDGLMSCRWVMPYRDGARLSLTNLGASPVKVALEVRTAKWTWDERSMHFRVNWRYEADMRTPPFADWNYIRIRGRGVYVGDTLALFNTVPTWYGEGNEKIWVDGESFPSHLGTGTEDYYNYSYAPKGIMQTPFANQVRIDQEMTQGHNVLTRARNLDGIPFERSLQFDIELIPWEDTLLTYAATTYWYAFPGAGSNVQPMPEAATRPFPRIWMRRSLGPNMMVSKLLPSAGKLTGLSYPASLEALEFKPRTFDKFCDLHAELGARAPEDLLVYYLRRFECLEPRKIAVLLGYDGPVKMWLDGKECFHDPDGTNPARIDSFRAEVEGAVGVHEILVALGSNCGKAWGIFLRLEELDFAADANEDQGLVNLETAIECPRSS